MPLGLAQDANGQPDQRDGGEQNEPVVIGSTDHEENEHARLNEEDEGEQPKPAVAEQRRRRPGQGEE